VGQAWFGVQKSSDLGLIFPWNSHTRDSHRCQEEACIGFLPRFARLRSRRAVEHGQKNTSTCSTRPEHARARPAPDPARPAPRQVTPVSLASARAYKASRSFSRTPRVLSTSPEQEIAGACPADGVPAAARAPATVDRPAEPSPTPSNPRIRLYVPRWSSQSEESSSASPETPDQGHRTSPDLRRT
jgi:hypothetical protein